jgi:hypothetical protein
MMTDLDTETVCLSKEQHGVFSCICYFDVFHHPVTLIEIFEFNKLETSYERVKLVLQELMDMDLISVYDDYYFLNPMNFSLLRKRKDSEERFYKKQRTIKFFADLISKFPFVESVSISGSCSKGLFDEDGDVDYFIITSAHRVWLCRTILIAFKKIFLFNSKKYFCVNYFVDINQLEIPDKNAFVAREIKTLVPVSNKAIFEKFLEKNIWTKDFLPNKMHYNAFFLNEKKPKKHLLGWMEWLLAKPFGNTLDKWCFEWTLSKWEKKFSHFSRADFDLNLRSKKAVSKHHPRGYQQKVLFEWNKKLAKIKLVA